MAIAIAGIVGLAVGRTVRQTTEVALRNDLTLKDDADDLRIAILEIRHDHRNLASNGFSTKSFTELRQSHADLLEEIRQVDAIPIADRSVPRADELRLLYEEYTALVGPALAAGGRSSAEFQTVDEAGLRILERLTALADQIDHYAEAEADIAIARIGTASENAELVQVLALGSLVLIGVALAYAATRVLAKFRRLYEAERLASGRLGLALGAKTDVIAMASHELRTPLTLVRGYAETGLAMEPDGPIREILEDIVAESAWMTRLVEDLLFLARSDAAGPPLATEPVPVATLLNAVAARTRVLVGQCGGSFATSLNASGMLTADPARIEQSILALIDNAAKFSPPGGVVRLSSTMRMQELVVEVADQGSGIPAEEQGRIFERFYRAAGANDERQSGAGLGLSIASTIVQAHGGRIEVHSRVGHGTRMRIYLPLAAGLPVHSAAVIAPPHGIGAELATA